MLYLPLNDNVYANQHGLDGEHNIRDADLDMSLWIVILIKSSQSFGSFKIILRYRYQYSDLFIRITFYQVF